MTTLHDLGERLRRFDDRMHGVAVSRVDEHVAGIGRQRERAARLEFQTVATANEGEEHQLTIIAGDVDCRPLRCVDFHADSARPIDLERQQLAGFQPHPAVQIIEFLRHDFISQWGLSQPQSWPNSIGTPKRWAAAFAAATNATKSRRCQWRPAGLTPSG